MAAGVVGLGPGAAAYRAAAPAACRVAADRDGGLYGCCGMDQLGLWS